MQECGDDRMKKRFSKFGLRKLTLSDSFKRRQNGPYITHSSKETMLNIFSPTWRTTLFGGANIFTNFHSIKENLELINK
jgi:hypothetical protein